MNLFGVSKSCVEKKPENGGTVSRETATSEGLKAYTPEFVPNES